MLGYWRIIILFWWWYVSLILHALVVLHCFFHIPSNRSLLKSLLVAFRGGIRFFGAGVLSSFVWVHLLHSFCSLVTELLQFYVFSGSYNSPAWLLETSLLFSRRWCYPWSVWFLRCPEILFCFSDSTPLTRLALSPEIMSVHEEPVYTVKGVVGLALGWWGCLHTSLGDWWLSSPRGLWEDFLLKSWVESAATVSL